MGLMSPGVSWLLTSRRATGLVSTVALLSTPVIIVAPATKVVVVASVVVAVVVAVVVIVVIMVIPVVTAVITIVVLAIIS